MEEINDFERTTLKGLTIPLHVGAYIKAKRCKCCDKVFFVNYLGKQTIGNGLIITNQKIGVNDYECHRCRGINISDFRISTKAS